MYKKFINYLPWASLQQVCMVILYTLLLPPLHKLFAVLLTVLMFTALHIPNKFLMATVFIIELIFLLLYTSVVSLAWMIPAHALIAVLIQRYVPDKITHGMTVLWKYHE